MAISIPIPTPIEIQNQMEKHNYGRRNKTDSRQTRCHVHDH